MNNIVLLFDKIPVYAWVEYAVAYMIVILTGLILFGIDRYINKNG